MRDEQVSQRKAGWRCREWERETGLGHTKTNELIQSGAIKSVKVGRARIITTPPREYFDSLAAQQMAA